VLYIGGFKGAKPPSKRKKRKKITGGRSPPAKGAQGGMCPPVEEERGVIYAPARIFKIFLIFKGNYREE
jgi:hypothetical protein